MFELDQINAVQQRAVAESWPYHYLFNSLKALGVERYEVNVLTHETKFVGMGASLLAPVPDGFRTLTVGEAYNEDALKKAIARSQAKESTYEEFLAEIAAAGVAFYRVDMKPRTVTYHGAGGKKLVEKVPES